MTTGRTPAIFAVCAVFYLALTGIDARVQASTVPSPAARKAESRLRDLIGKVFTQAEIMPKGETNERRYRFEVFDEKNGYARVLGPFGGYDDFFLLRGENQDYLLFMEYSCGPTCTQHATVHRFDAGAEPVLMPLTKILDLSEFKSIQRRFLTLCLDSVGHFATETSVRDAAHQVMPACPYLFSFPKKGSAAILFKVQSEYGGDLLLSVGKTRVSPQILLRWNGSKLIGSEPADDESILLDSSEKMRVFF